VWVEKVRKLGCYEAIDYKTTRFEYHVRDVDVVLDPWAVIRSEPRQDVAPGKGCVRHDDRRQARWRLADIGTSSTTELRHLVYAVFPLVQVKEALALSRSRHAAGKIVLTI
jgi:hypothetical protein